MSLRWGTAGHKALLCGAALLIGTAAGVLPVPIAGALVVGVVLMVLVAIEPMAGLAITLGVGPLKTLIETEAAYPLPIDVGQIALAATFGAWFAHKAAKRESPHPYLCALLPYLRTREVSEDLSPPGHADKHSFAAPGARDLKPNTQALHVFLPLLLFIFVSALSLIEAPALGAGLRELLKWVEVALVAALTRDLIGDDAQRLRWAVWAVLVAGAGHALIGIYEFFGGSGADHLAITISGGRYYRAFGSFGQPNPFAGFMGVCLPLALGGLWSALSGKDRLGSVMYGGAAALTAGGLLAAWSRGAWMGAAAAGVMMALFLPHKLRHGLMLLGGLLMLLALVWASGKLPGAIMARITDFTDIGEALSDVRGVDIDGVNYAEVERFAHWQAALGMAEAQPWLGVGLGNYPVVYPDYALMNWPDPLGHAHNYYLNTLAETGLLGLGAYLLMGAAVIGATLRVLRSPAMPRWERGVALGLLGIWTHLAVHSLLDKLYVNNVFLHIGVLLGILAALHTEESAVLSYSRVETRSNDRFDNRDF